MVNIEDREKNELNQDYGKNIWSIERTVVHCFVVRIDDLSLFVELVR